MGKSVLITGGAGFIGAHLANELLANGYVVTALDSLVPQVHGEDRTRPKYLSNEVHLIRADIRDEGSVARALSRIDLVVHLVSLVGVGQSMYQIDDYTSVNNYGTAVLLQAVSKRPVERLVVASSMSIYGEGLYCDKSGKIRPGMDRSLDQLRRSEWEVIAADGERLIPVPTPEEKPPALASVYALSKYDQERMCLIVGNAYQIPTVALRLFNTYGPYQALSNPYTGVLSNFASRILNGNSPLLFEDGLQQRDIVSVYDVAVAFRLALEAPGAVGRALNISSGKATTIKDVAERTIKTLGRTDLEPNTTGKYRVGDIRHCFANISLAKEVLGWEPRVSLEQGLEDLAGWLQDQTARDMGLKARAELAARGLMV